MEQGLAERIVRNWVGSLRFEKRGQDRSTLSLPDQAMNGIAKWICEARVHA